MKKTMYILATALAVLTSCGDSLEDTYKDFAGDGPIRYTGKCTNISVNPGWECLRTKWTPSKDPAVKNIRITWISENSDTATAEVAPTDTVYTIKGLTNQNYQVMVQSVAENGTPSLADKITPPVHLRARGSDSLHAGLQQILSLSQPPSALHGQLDRRYPAFRNRLYEQGRQS